MVRTTGEGFLWKSDWPSRRKNGQCDPVKGGHRRTGERSRGGTRERKVVVGASHHQAYFLGYCEDLGGTQLSEWAERISTMSRKGTSDCMIST